MALHGALRDALPDAWGQHVILARLTGKSGRDGDTGDLSPITYMRNSSSDRSGAIDFQDTPDTYVPRYEPATLDDLSSAALALEEGRPLPAGLDAALTHGTSVGGARPKATLTDRTGSWIAKFSSSSDRGNPAVRYEAMALRLAALAGVDTVDAQLTTAAGRETLLVRRFDRTPEGGRLMVVSGLTMLQLDEMAGRYATYPGLLDVLKGASQRPERAGKELFNRVAANIALGNTDDHARNHAALWDGQQLTLAPAYDIDPCRTPGWNANQAMAYGRDGERASSLDALIRVSATYDLDRVEASSIVDRVVTTIEDNWKDAANEVGLTQRQAESIYGSRILNASTTDGLPRPTPTSWSSDARIAVETGETPSRGRVWVTPHRRDGHPVDGYWRTMR
jgi:serine/threonine-protein kinase HipA